MNSEDYILSHLMSEVLLPPPISTLHISVDMPGYTFREHVYEDEVEIVYVYKGASYVGIGKQFIRIQKNDCLIIFPHVSHNYFLKENESSKIHDLVFKISDLQNFGSEELRNHVRFLYEFVQPQIDYLKFIDSGELLSILEHIHDQHANPTRYSRMLLKVYFCELFIYLSKVIGETRDEMGKRKNHHVTTGLDYMVNFYSSKLTVEEIAQHVGLSPRHFSRLFIQEMGMTVQDYLGIFRIKKAKELLLNSDMDITQIAYSLGFNSSQYFTTCFKRIEHITPKIYRRMNRVERAYGSVVGDPE